MALSGVTKFDARELGAVTIDATLQGQGVNTMSMGLPQPSIAKPELAATGPSVLPGLGRT